MSFKGDLNTISLADLLHTISISQKEGTLIVIDGENKKLIYFTQEGVSLISSGKRKSPRIGEILVKSGKITEGQLEQVLDQQKSSGKKTGEILISSGLVTEPDISSAVKSQIEEEFYDLFCWDHASFEFVEGPPSDDHMSQDFVPHSLTLDVNALLAGAAHRLDEWHQFHSVIPDTKAVFVFTSGEAPILPDEAEKGLQEIVELIDGKRTVEDIIAQSGLTRFDACRYVYMLFAQKLLKNSGFIQSTSEEKAKIAKLEAPRIDVHHEIAQLLEQAAKLPPKDTKRLIPIYQKILQLDPNRVSVKIKLDKVLKEKKKAFRRLIIRMIILLPVLVLVTAGAYAVKFELDVRKDFQNVKNNAAYHVGRDDLVLAKESYDKFVKEHPYNLITKEATRCAADIQSKINARQRQAEDNYKKEIEAITSAFDEMAVHENEFTAEQLIQGYDEFAKQAKVKDALNLYADILKKKEKLLNFIAEADKFYQEGVAFEQNGDFEKAIQLYMLILKSYSRSPHASGINFMIKIESTPPGADIYINEQKTAVTPFIMRYKPGSFFNVSIYRRGFETYTTAVDSRNYMNKEMPLVHLNHRLVKTMKWKFETQGVIYSRPVEKNGILYFGSRDGSLYALDIQAQKDAWVLSTPTTADIESSPAIFDNNIYIGCNDSYLYSVNIQTKSFEWNFKTQLFVKSAPLISPNGKVLYIGSSDGKVYAIDAKAGATVYWQTPLGASVTAQPLLYSNTIFVGTESGKICALNAVSGDIIWTSKNTAGSFVSSPAISDNVLYAGSTNGILYAINIADGSVLWTFKANGAIYSMPVFHKGLVIISSTESKVFAVNTMTQLEQWRIPLSGSVVSSGSIDNGVYYTGCEDGALYAVDCDNAIILWSYKTEAPIHAAPLVTGEHVFIGSDDKCMYVLEK